MLYIRLYSSPALYTGRFLLFNPKELTKMSPIITKKPPTISCQVNASERINMPSIIAMTGEMYAIKDVMVIPAEFSNEKYRIVPTPV